MLNNTIKSLGLILIISLSTISCKLQKNQSEIESSVSNINVVNEAINTILNTSDSIQVIKNSEGNWELYLTESNSEITIPDNNISFFIYDRINNKILYQNNFNRAQIKWYNNNQLLLKRYYGITENTTDSNIKSYIIDIKTKKITEHSTLKEKSII